MDAECHDDGGKEGSEHRWADEYLRVELLQAVLALDEHHACGEDEEGVGHIEQGGVKHGVRAEDARYDRIADEATLANMRAKPIMPWSS